MNTMQEALSKAGLNAEDFKGNEKQVFSMFPFITKWRAILPDKAEYMEEHYKYQQSCKSKLLWKWMEKQNSSVIGFLRKNKERVYVFSSNDCTKFLEAWIGYSSKYQKFVIRVNPLAQAICPWSMPTNSYAGRLLSSIDKILGLRNSGLPLEGLKFVEILNRIPSDQVAHIIRKTFENGIIPVEQFDPIVETNSLVSESMITAESTNLDEIRKQLAQLDEESGILEKTKLHKNVVDLWCTFNNIRVIDPSNVWERRDRLNLILAKDEQQDNHNKKKKEKTIRNFFMYMVI